MENKYAKAEKLFKALADENRIKILAMLVDGEKFAGSLLQELEVSQPTLSHHMKTLCESGLVYARKDGKWIYYSIPDESRDMAFDILAEIMISADERKAFVTKKKTKRSSDNIVIL